MTSRIPNAQRLAAGESTEALSNVLAIDFADGAEGAQVTIAGSTYEATGAGRVVNSGVPLQQVKITAAAGSDLAYRVWTGNKAEDRPFLLTPALPIRTVTSDGNPVSSTNPLTIDISQVNGGTALAAAGNALPAVPGANQALLVGAMGRDSTGQGRVNLCSASDGAQLVRGEGLSALTIATQAAAFDQTVDTSEYEHLTGVYACDDTAGAGLTLNVNFLYPGGSSRLIGTIVVAAGATVAGVIEIGPGVDTALAAANHIAYQGPLPLQVRFSTTAGCAVGHSLDIVGR